MTAVRPSQGATERITEAADPATTAVRPGRGTAEAADSATTAVRPGRGTAEAADPATTAVRPAEATSEAADAAARTPTASSPSAAEIVLRRAVATDIPEAGRILYEAFASLATEHGFAPDFATVEAATSCMTGLIGNPGFHGLVAELDGRMVGSSFLDERSTIAAIGPVSVEPSAQDHHVGHALVGALLERAASRRAPGVRLVQISYHNRSLSLYAKLGFTLRETFAAMHGELAQPAMPGYVVRLAASSDADACNALCLRVHGHDRAGEVGPGIAKGKVRVVERLGRVTGYATGIGYFSHAVAETTDDLCALIGSVERIEPPGIIVPLADAELFRWCLAQGLRVFFVMNLMTIGIYQPPEGAYLPSVGY